MNYLQSIHDKFDALHSNFTKKDTKKFFEFLKNWDGFFKKIHSVEKIYSVGGVSLNNPDFGVKITTELKYQP